MIFKDLAIVVHTMDKYEFCWNGWYETFKKYWDFNLNIDIYFANEVKDINFPGIKQLKTGVGEWSDRLNKAFNMIPHKHVFYWQEDMWMIQELKNIRQYYQDFINYDMDYLIFMSKILKVENGYVDFEEKILLDKYLKFNIEICRWIIFHQPAIWKKEFFLKYLQHCEDPWVNEIEGTKRAREDNKIKKINIYNVYDLNKWYQPVVHKGKFIKSAEEILNGTYKIL